MSMRSQGTFWHGLLVAVALALAGGSGIASAQSGDPARAAEELARERDAALARREEALRRLEEKRRALEALRAKEQELSRSVGELDRERAELNQKLIDTAARIQAGEARLTEIETRVAQLAAREHEIRGSIQEHHASIAELLAAMQRLGGQPPPAIVTRPDDVLKMIRSAMLMAKLFPELRQQADALNRSLDEMRRLQADMAAEGERLKQESIQLAQERKAIAALLAEKKTLMAKRSDELAAARRTAEQSAKNVTELSELVQRMDKELADKMALYEAELAAAQAKRDAELAAAEARRQAELAAAAKREQEKDANKQLAQNGEAQAQREGEPAAGDAQRSVDLTPKREPVAFLSPGRIKPAIPFAEARGTLRLPVQGATLRRFGEPDGFGGTSKGITVRTRDNAQVTSPADGWVVYADEFRGYGQVLIINAGEGYHVLLAGMKRIDVGLGQFVLAGEPVAVMDAAASGERQETGQAHPMLYIEFRKNGQPIDPDPWWVENPEKVQG